MKVLIYSDVHGNLPAFEKMLNTEKECEQYICLGDLVNYGPWSNECVDLALSLNSSVIIKGNHEEDFIKGKYSGSNRMVQDFFKKTYASFTRFEEINKFKEHIRLSSFLCIHTIDNEYIYPDTKIILDQNYLIGHSHHQFEYHNNDFVLYNVGSVGQNRKYINEINYIVFDTETQKIQLKSILYDLNILISEMKLRNYTEECINYYRNKEIKK
jgi:predicted phosphodiesterase